MKIVEFDRIENEIHAVLENGEKVLLDWGYILENKPQVGDHYGDEPVVPPVEEVKEETVEPVIETVVEPVTE